MILNNERMYDSLNVLSQVEEKGMLGYAIARNRQKLLAELGTYAGVRNELIQEYGEDIGNGQFNFTPESMTRFREALEPYNILTADVQLMQVSPEVFYSGNLTSSQMFILEWMVKDGDKV